MRTDLVPFGGHLFLNIFVLKCNRNLVSFGSVGAFKYHKTWEFIGDPCAINDSNEFPNSFNSIYPQELELKIEYQGTHATNFDLGITIEDGVFMYKCSDEIDKFSLCHIFLLTSSVVFFMVHFILNY